MPDPSSLNMFEPDSMRMHIVCLNSAGVYWILQSLLSLMNIGTLLMCFFFLGSKSIPMGPLLLQGLALRPRGSQRGQQVQWGTLHQRMQISSYIEHIEQILDG